MISPQNEKRNITAISLYLFIFYSFAVLMAFNAGRIAPSFFESLHAVMEVDLIFAGTVDLPWSPFYTYDDKITK